MTKRKERIVNDRPIVTTYYKDLRANHETKTNRSSYGKTAVQNAVGHMHDDRYDAFIAIVFDEMENEVYAVIIRNVVGSVKIWYHGDPNCPKLDRVVQMRDQRRMALRQAARARKGK